MSDDPVADFFSSDDQGSPSIAPSTSQDDQIATFFAKGAQTDASASKTRSVEPTYDAALFKKRVGRDPEPAELANFKANKGQGWAGANGTAGGSFAGLGEAALATGAGTLKGISHAANDILPDVGGSKAAVEKEIQTDPVLNYKEGPEAQPYLEGVSKLATPVTWAVNKARNAIANVAGTRTADVASDVATLLPGARGAFPKGSFAIHDPEAVAATAAPTAEEALAKSAAESKGNMGAAEAPISLEGTSPELRQAVANAQNHDTDALNRHINAETLPQPEGITPLRLRKGQATRDEQQISDEKNLRADPDTQGLLGESITDQNEKLGSSMGEIRRRATPDIVQRSNAEHGQTAIDAIKAQDNAAVTDIRAKYKELADQNGGDMPLSTGTAAADIKAALSKGLLTKVAAADPVISEVMDNLSSGQPMSFESFHSALSNLAEVQRNKGSPAAAATIVRNALENMPLTPEAAKLKGLRDIASAAAKRRFDTIEQNPAYEAAINDNVPKTPNGLHTIGNASPLADTFMDRYFLGNGTAASRAYVARIKDVMQNNPDFAPSIEASALNKLRDSAGLDSFDNGNFRHAGYRNARNAMDKKADVLLSPESEDFTSRLRQASDDVGYEGKASSVNRSNTALTLQRFGALYPETPGIAGTLADYGTDIAAAHAGPMGYAAKKIISAVAKGSKDRKAVEATKNAKLKFAQDAVAPGAGIERSGNSRIITRATGGKVDHEALVERLISRWKAAKKETDKKTEPLLSQPDSAIMKALELSQRAI